MKKHCLILVAGLLMAMPTVATEVYVGTTNAADDGDHGTSSAPYATVAYAVSQLGSDGGTVWVQPGTYASATLITVSTPVRIAGLGAAPSDTTLSGSGVIQVVKLNHESAELLNLTITKGYLTKNKTEMDKAGLTVEAGTVSNCFVTACTGDGNWSDFANIKQTGGLIVDCVISDGRLPNVPAEFVSTHALGAYLAGTARMERCLFKDFNSSDARGYVVYVGSKSAVLSNCTVVDSCVKYRKTCPGYGIYATAGTVENCAVIGVRRSGSTLSGAYYAPGLAPWGGKAECFSNCVTDGDAAINENCYTVASDSAFTDYSNGDYSPAAGSVLATQGIGYKAYSGAGLDAAFGVDRYVGTTAYEFTFTASVAGAAGSVSYQWDFDGDGTFDETTSSASTTHSYASCGAYSPKLKVSDGASEKTVTRTSLVTVGPAVVYVDAASTAAESPYVDSSKAAKTIKDAVAVGVDGTEIRVAKGIYPITTDGGAIVLTKGIRVIGQGEPSEVVVSNKTVAGNHCFMVSLNHPDALVANFSLQKGDFKAANESGVAGKYASGVNILADGGTVSNCIITACTTHGNQNFSGAMRLTAGLVTRCIVEKCVLENGETIHGTVHAGGAYIIESGRLENSLFRDFASKSYGHLIWMDSSAAVMDNCTFVNSTLSSYGSSNPCNAIYAPNGTVRNCAVYGVGRIAVGSTPATDNASWSGKAANFTNCATPGDPINDTCVTITEADFADYANGDYVPALKGRLQDAGADYAGVSQLDLAGNGRICGDVVDIGAYEYQSGGFNAQFTSSISAGVTPVAVEFVAQVDGATGTVTYDWDFNGDGVYEVLGRTIPAVTNEYLKSGTYSVVLRVNDSAVATPLVVTKENCLTLKPSVIYVDAASADPVVPYDDPAHAATTIAEAVAQGGDGSKVLVAAGDYPIATPIQIASGIRVLGATGKPDDVIVRNTAFTGLNSLAVLAASDAMLANVTLTNGYTNTQPTYGSGVTIEAQGGTVSNCVIVGCTGSINQDKAGGAYVKAGLLTHCVIASCGQPAAEMMKGEYKASGAVVNGSGSIANTLFRNFKSSARGHIVWVDSAYASVVNCTVTDSEVSYYQSSNMSVTYPAYGVYCLNGTVRNCAILGVSRVAYGSEPAVPASPWAGTAANFYHCATDGDAEINGTCVLGTTATAFRDYAAGKYFPRIGGVLVDAGAEIANPPSVDLCGKPRVQGKAIDIGCYESSDRGLILIIR